jgi:hypothetical protein
MRMSLLIWNHRIQRLCSGIVVLAIVMLIPLASCNKVEKLTTEKKKPSASETAQKAFTSPEEADVAFFEAAKAGDRSALLTIFGPDGKGVLFTDNEANDNESLRDFVAAYNQMHRWGKIKAGGEVLHIGADNCPFPIPLGQNPSGQWYFDTAAGKDEILARRIGRGQSMAIATCEAAASRLGEFAKALGSSNAGGGPTELNGYHYRMLTKQGNKVKRSILAYSVEYKNSGIMSFLVGQDGVVLQKDLGENTADVGAAMTEYNPGDNWDRAVLPQSSIHAGG